MNREVIEATENICDKVGRQMVKVSNALDEEGGKLPANDVTYLKELTGALKNAQTILAMAGEGSSERRGRDSMGRYTSRAEGPDGDGNTGFGYYPMRAWDDGRGYRGGSYDGRSMHGNEVKQQLRELMEQAEDEHVKRALRTAMQQM